MTEFQHFSQTMDEHVNSLHALGFETVLEDDFIGHNVKINESFLVLWHPDGVLAAVESFDAVYCASSKLYYNVRTSLSMLDEYYRYVQNGYLTDDLVWVGSNDSRDNVESTFNGLSVFGTTLNPWVSRPDLRLVTYVEGQDSNIDSLETTEERISRLPENVRKAITPND
jgi:hypothetical protein